jgi:hypothetical protein
MIIPLSLGSQFLPLGPLLLVAHQRHGACVRKRAPRRPKRVTISPIVYDVPIAHDHLYVSGGERRDRWDTLKGVCPVPSRDTPRKMSPHVPSVPQVVD